MTARIDSHPILPEPDQTREVSFTFNGAAHTGIEGEPVAVSLLAAGTRQLRSSPVRAEARGIYCGIGHCYECRLWLGDGDGSDLERVRGCQVPLREGDRYSSERPSDAGDSHDGSAA